MGVRGVRGVREVHRTRATSGRAGPRGGPQTHACIGTEHLLLGLIAKKEDPLVQVLRRLGLETTAIRDKVAEMRPPGRVSAIGRIPLTPRAKTALERSGIEAELRGHPHIDAEHLLWGLSRQTDATATKALTRMGATPDRIRHQVLLSWGQSA
jgi:ATP-dependent Clp protease ATP-binding subunit ClpC